MVVKGPLTLPSCHFMQRRHSTELNGPISTRCLSILDLVIIFRDGLKFRFLIHLRRCLLMLSYPSHLSSFGIQDKAHQFHLFIFCSSHGTFGNSSYPSIYGIGTGDLEHRVALYADDTVVFLSNLVELIHPS